MSQFKGTKGKWYLQEFTDSYTNIVRCDNGVHNTLLIAYMSQGHDFQEKRMNALLISKAPEMLDMLIEMKGAMLELMNHQDGWEDYYTKLCELIESATNLK